MILGGGRDAMGAPADQPLPPYNFTGGMEKTYPRSDGMNLPQNWVQNKTDLTKHAYYVTSKTELNKVVTAETDYLMG